MIKTAIQLKAKVRNKSNGNDKIAKTMIRLFFMERFLERVSLSKYKEQFILKGGMLTASLLGIHVRATMDIDTTVRALPLIKEDMEKIIKEICELPLDDCIMFKIVRIDTIMDEFEYPGIRIHLEANLEKLRQPIKIDISTDDVITPGAIEYGYPLIFENRKIELYTYNIETLLAEKTQTIISRGTANTRMRDFYDLYEIIQKMKFSWNIYKDAFDATCRRRQTVFTKEEIKLELQNLHSSIQMEEFWNQFKYKNYFVEDIEYSKMLSCLSEAILRIS